LKQVAQDLRKIVQDEGNEVEIIMKDLNDLEYLNCQAKKKIIFLVVNSDGTLQVLLKRLPSLQKLDSLKEILVTTIDTIVVDDRPIEDGEVRILGVNCHLEERLGILRGLSSLKIHVLEDIDLKDFLVDRETEREIHE
jgi:RNase P subunit Pop3